jgi:hypothetical protein
MAILFYIKFIVTEEIDFPGDPELAADYNCPIVKDSFGL